MNSIICYAFLVVALVVVDFQSVLARQDDNDNDKEPDLQSVDHLELVLNWGPTMCLTGYINCGIKPQPKFTIHGLWAQQRPRGGVNGCPVEKYDGEKLEPIIKDMHNFWPTLSTYGDESFWRHEWNKHGGCAFVAEGINSFFSYFEATIRLFRRLRINETLRESGYVPSDQVEYPAEDIQYAITEMHRAHVNLNCYIHPETDVAYLKEVYVCYDKNLRPSDCPEIKSRCEGRNVILSNN